MAPTDYDRSWRRKRDGLSERRRWRSVRPSDRNAASVLRRVDHRGVHPRTRPLPRRALVRGGGEGLLHRLRAGGRRLERPPRHALEALRRTAGRLRQVLRRRRGRLHAGHRRHGDDDRGGEGQELPPQAGVAPRGHRRGGARGELHPGRRHLRLDLLRQRPHRAVAEGGHRVGGQRRRTGGLPAGRPDPADRRPHHRQLQRHAAPGLVLGERPPRHRGRARRRPRHARGDAGAANRRDRVRDAAHRHARHPGVQFARCDPALDLRADRGGRPGRQRELFRRRAYVRLSREAHHGPRVG